LHTQFKLFQAIAFSSNLPFFLNELESWPETCN